MAGQTGLNGDLRSLQVADLTHHHHVGILTEDGAQTTGKAHVDLVVDLGLTDAVDVVFNRVFHRNDVAAAFIELAESCIERGGFS